MAMNGSMAVAAELWSGRKKTTSSRMGQWRVCHWEVAVSIGEEPRARGLLYRRDEVVQKLAGDAGVIPADEVGEGRWEATARDQ